MGYTHYYYRHRDIAAPADAYGRFAMDAEHFYQAYLIGYMFVLGLTLGGLGFTMIHQLSGGAWGVVARQSLGAASRVLPLLTAAINA